MRPRVAQAKSRDLDTFADFGQETSHGLGGSGGVIRVVVVVAVGEWTATRRRLGGQGACLFGLLKHGQKNQEIGGNCEIVVQMSGFWMPPLSWRRRVRRPRSALAESSHNCTCRIGPPSIRKTVKKKKKANWGICLRIPGTESASRVLPCVWMITAPPIGLLQDFAGGPTAIFRSAFANQRGAISRSAWHFCRYPEYTNRQSSTVLRPSSWHHQLNALTQSGNPI